MQDVNVSDEKKQQLRSEFKRHLAVERADRKDNGSVLSDAFFPSRTNIGIDFWDIFTSNDSIQLCREKLENYFEHTAKRKTPKSDSYTYITAIKKLKSFIDSDYGGINKFLGLPEIENPAKNEYANPISISDKTTKVNSSKTFLEVPCPCCDEIDKYLLRWDDLENYSLQESALDKLFLRTYPYNTEIDDILVKVSTLNDFYSTNIFSPFQIAKHILVLNIDERLSVGDVTLVNEIAKVRMNNNSLKNFYSFATKYCSHHNPLDFPIYDSYVDRLLRYFRDTDGFFAFNNNDLKQYADFKNILIKFRNYYKLEAYNLKEIDKYLWQLGKETFPKKYK